MCNLTCSMRLLHRTNSNKNIAFNFESTDIFTSNLIDLNLMNQVLNIITQIHFHSLPSIFLPDTLFCFSQPELNDKTLKEDKINLSRNEHGSLILIVNCISKQRAT